MIIQPELILPEDIAREAERVVRSRSADITDGSSYNIWLFGNYAAKSSKGPKAWKNGCARSLENEAMVGRALKLEDGMQLPEMHGLYVPETDEHAILVMDRLNIVNLDKLKRSERVDAIQQYLHQIFIAKQAGFEIADSDISMACGLENAGYDRQQKKTYLFDFEAWELPKSRLLV